MNEHDPTAASHNRCRICCAVNGSDIVCLKSISRFASVFLALHILILKKNWFYQTS